MPQHLTVFLATTLLMLVVPGPDFVLVTRNALAGGRRLGYRTAAGICAGLAFLTLLSAAGLAGLPLTGPRAADVLRFAGGGYLVFLGVSLLRTALRAPARAAENDERDAAPAKRPGARSATRQGFWNNVLNPKALVFYLTFMPQFLTPRAPVLPQALLLGALVVACAALWWTAFVTVVGRAAAVLRHPRARAVVDVLAAAALVGIGVLFLTGLL